MLSEMLKYATALMLSVLSISSIYAQENIRFFHLTSKDGLSKNSVLNIFQDSRGFMWFGTRDGLNKYDGYEFTIYREDKFDTSSIRSNSIADIDEDMDGNLWITSHQGVSMLKRDQEVFVHFGNSKVDSLSYNFSESKDIFIDNANRVFVGGSGGLGLFNKTRNHFEPVFIKPINTIYNDHQGTLWVGTVNDGIYLLDDNTFEVKKHYVKDINKPDTPGGEIVTTIKEDVDGTFWIGYAKAGLDHFVPSTEKFHHYLHDPGNPQSLCNNAVRVIADGPEGELWIGTYKGISRMDRKKGEIRFNGWLNHENDDYSLSHNSIYDIYKDVKGAVWIATYFGGLSIYDAKSQLFDYYKPEPHKQNSLSYHVVGQFEDAGDNKLWIATEGGGLNLFDRSNGSFENFSHDPKNPNSLPDDNIKAIGKTREGHLWLAMLTQGLVSFNSKTKKATRFNMTNSSLKNNNVSSFLIDHEHVLWVGTRQYLYQYDKKTNKFTEFLVPGSQNPYNIKFLMEASDHNIWIGTLGGGLFLYNRKTHKMTNYHFDAEISSDWGHNLINFLHEDQHQNIWIGTFGGGLLKFKPSDGSFKAFYTGDGLANNIVFGIVEDNSGLLWISTSSGLSRFDPKTEVFKTFGANSNLALYEFNERSCYKSKDGTVFMGGLNGFITFNPEQIKDTKFDAPMVLTTLKIANKLVRPGDKNSILKKAINEQPGITLDYTDRNISIGYASLNYLLSGENQYAYMLEGFDDNWNFVGSRREATYTNLPPGSYTLKIKTYDNEEALNNPSKSIAITILSPPWKSWWAYLIYISVIIGALYLLTATLQYKANMEKNLQLEHLEKEKIEELNNFKLRFYTNISHEFRTPLTLIISPLESLIASKTGDSYLRKQHQLIYKNANRLQNLINELMDFRKIETSNLHLKVGKGNIVKFIKEIKISFDEYARERGITYSIHTRSDDIQLYYDRDQLEKVFFNLLSNAFKFTENGGKINLIIQQDAEEKCVKIAVNDAGRGMTEAQSKHVFERFYQIEAESPKKQKGTGLGLALASEIVNLHHGSISVESKVGTGTSFTVALPTGKAHFRSDEIIAGFKDSEYISPYYNNSMVHLDDLDNNASDLLPMGDLPNELPLVLIVEDNYEIRKYLTDIFKKSYRLVEAADGDEALELAKKHVPDLIISDIMMPGSNGIDLCSNIKRGLSTSHIPIILLTARTSLIYQANGLETGADDYVTKPFNARLLSLKAANLIKTRQNLKKHFLGEVNIEPQKIAVTPVDEKFMRKAIEVIEENLEDPNFDVNMFVNLMNAGRSTLFAKIKNLTGQTPNDFIRTIRLKRAAQILQQDKLTNSEICYMVGFSTPRHFRKCFLEFFGKTPIQYAKDYQLLK